MTPINKRMIKARFYSKHKKMTVIQVYARTNESAEDEKDYFHNQLREVITDCNKHDFIVLMGDLNAAKWETTTKTGKRLLKNIE